MNNFSALPIQSNSRKAEDGHWTEDFVQELDDLTEDHGIDPPAAVRADTEDNVERHTD